MSAEAREPGRYVVPVLAAAGLGLLGAAWALLGRQARPEGKGAAEPRASLIPLGGGEPNRGEPSAAAGPPAGSSLALVREHEPGALSRAGIAGPGGSAEPSARIEARAVIEKKLIEDRLGALLTGAGAPSEGAPSEDLSEVGGGAGYGFDLPETGDGKPAFKTMGERRSSGGGAGGGGGYAAPRAAEEAPRASRAVIPPSSPGGILLSRFTPPERQRLTGRLEAGDRLIPACRSSGLERQCVSAGQHCVKFDNCRGWLAVQLGVAGAVSAAIEAGGSAATGAGAQSAARGTFEGGGAAGKAAAGRGSGGGGGGKAAGGPGQTRPSGDSAAGLGGAGGPACGGRPCLQEPAPRDPRVLDPLPPPIKEIPPRVEPRPSPLPIGPGPGGGSFPLPRPGPKLGGGTTGNLDRPRGLGGDTGPLQLE